MGRPAIQFVGLFCAEARRGFDSGGCELPLFVALDTVSKDTVPNSVSREE